MDVLLLKDIEKIGTEGSVIRVKPGFARNYLLPQGLAVLASAEQVRALEERKRIAQQKAARIRKHAEQLKQRIESRSLTLKLALGEAEKAFGAVTAHEIAEALAKDGSPIEKHAVHLEEPIKALGIYEVPVRLHPDVTATAKVWVVKA